MSQPKLPENISPRSSSITPTTTERFSRPIKHEQTHTQPRATSTKPILQEINKKPISSRTIHELKKPTTSTPQPKENFKQKTETQSQTDPTINEIHRIGGEDLAKEINLFLTNHPKAIIHIEKMITLARFEGDKKATLYLKKFLSIKDKEAMSEFIKKLNNQVVSVINESINNQLNTLQKARAKDLLVPKEDTLATDYARILANIIIKDDGSTDLIALKVLANKEITETLSTIHNQHISQMLQQLDQGLTKNLENIKAPPKSLQNSDTADFIRMAINKKMGEPLNNTDAKRAALICLLDELYQEDIASSCYTTTLAMNIRTQFPELFLKDISDIIKQGYYTRTINGNTYTFTPMSKALDEKLDSGKIKKNSDINENNLYSIITAFKNSGIDISINQIKDLIKSKDISLKELIKFFTLKQIGLTEDSLNLIKKQNPKNEKYQQYIKLKNQIQQNFSNNRINRLLSSYQYSLGTASLETPNTHILQQTPRQTFLSGKINTLFDLTPKFEKLKERISPNSYENFLTHFNHQIESRIKLQYHKNRRLFIDKEQDKELSSIEDLQSTISSIIENLATELEAKPEEKQQLLSLANHLKSDRQKNSTLKILQENYQKHTNTTESDPTKLFKKFTELGSVAETFRDYTAKTEFQKGAIRIKPNSPKDLLLQLISLGKSLNGKSSILPTSAGDHAFSLLPNQGLFQEAIQSKNTTHWLNTLPPETTIVLADTNYLSNGMHVYLGIRKTKNNYELVEIADGDPNIAVETLPKNEANIYLNNNWDIITTFNEDINSLKTKQIRQT